MATTQSNRHAQLITPLGEDELLFWRMVATEGVSQLFDYDLMVLSENEQIELDDLIGQHVHVEMELQDEGTRYFCGHVTRFSFMGYRGNLARYQVRLRPWLWFLTRTTNCRIFQKQSVVDIIREVCREHGFTDIDERLSGNYKPREFCVQYRETDFDFISRLMEDEGIYYYFVHEEGKHEMVLSDSISSHEAHEGYEFVPWHHPDQADNVDRDHLESWQASRAVRSGKYALRDYNFTTPKANLEVKSQMTREIEHAEYEIYDYPGHYDNVEDGETYARLRMEAAQADFEVLAGSGNAKGLIPGFLFELENYPRDNLNREYLILSVSHDISQNTYDTESGEGNDRFDYSCSLKAMSSSEVFRPPLSTRRPLVHGPQTAVVVGESGEDIWTDEHGRIKIQFHWDRKGSNDENSSCWVRVSQAWAGKKWGAQFLPRIGHEVIVEFLEGDPDRPIVTGSVYNADNKPPYDLPANATQSGIKTRSSKNGTASNYNEIRFEDKKGSEQLYIHAEKDMDSHVENNQTHMVDANRTTTIAKDDMETVHGDRKRNVDGKEDVNIIGNWTQKIASGVLDIDVQSNQLKQISTGLDVTSRTNTNSTAAINMDFSAGVNVSTTAGANVSTTAGAAISMTAGAGISLTSPGPISIQSAAGVSILHNPHTDTGIMRTVIDQLNEDISQMKKSIKFLSFGYTVVSQSITGISNSFTDLSISHTYCSMGTTFCDISQKVYALENGVLKLQM